MNSLSTFISRQGMIPAVDKCSRIASDGWLNGWTGATVLVDWSWQNKDRQTTTIMPTPGCTLVGCLNNGSGFQIYGLQNLYLIQVLDGSSNVSTCMMALNPESARQSFNRNAGMTVGFTWNSSTDELIGYTFDNGFQEDGMSVVNADISTHSPDNWGDPDGQDLTIGGQKLTSAVTNDCPNDMVIHKVAMWKDTVLSQANLQALCNNINYGASRKHTNWSHRTLTHTEAGVTAQPTHLWDFENLNLADGDQQNCNDTGSASADNRICYQSHLGTFIGRRKVYT